MNAQRVRRVGEYRALLAIDPNARPRSAGTLTNSGDGTSKRSRSRHLARLEGHAGAAPGANAVQASFL
jgi:hypothetical protein